MMHRSGGGSSCEASREDESKGFREDEKLWWWVSGSVEVVARRAIQRRFEVKLWENFRGFWVGGEGSAGCRGFPAGVASSNIELLG